MEQREGRGSTKEMDVVEIYNVVVVKSTANIQPSSSSKVDMAAPTVKRRVLHGQITTFIITGHTPSIALLGLTLE